MTVSIPEKTLEHWASQYIMYRYRSKAAVWWPAHGEDVNVRWLPHLPGKAIQLEIKTTKKSSANKHDVEIDLGQLWDYWHRPRSRQPFYVIPHPHWTGDFKAAAHAAGTRVTECGFSRSGPPWWFATWMIVLPTADVQAVLSSELAAHGSGKRGTRKRLVRFDLSGGTPPVAIWGASATTPATAPRITWWLDFWPRLERCGSSTWPQLIRLPATFLHARRPYTHEEIAELLEHAGRELASGGWAGADDDRNGPVLVTLEQDADGAFVPMDDPPVDIDRPTDDGDPDEHRQVVFLAANAAQTARRR